MKPAKAAAIVAALISVAFLSLIVTHGHAASNAYCGARQAQAEAITKVIWIWGENKAFGQIIGSSSAPFSNELAAKCGLATNYYATTHPSLPNYIAATAGSTRGISTNCAPSSCAVTGSSIYSQGSSWWQAMESGVSPCRLTDSYPYVVRHNPAAYFLDIRSACQTQTHSPVPAGQAVWDALIGGTKTLPRFTFYVPNNCNNSHDCSIRTWDDWLRVHVAWVRDSAEYQAGKIALFVGWDEDNGSSGNRVAMQIVSPYTIPGQRSSTAFSHYGLLRTTEQLLGYPCLRNACSANSMLGFF
jgi:hypothetical protein